MWPNIDISINVYWESVKECYVKNKIRTMNSAILCGAVMIIYCTVRL